MAINYVIDATIIDIRNDQPDSKDIFFVDTNVWFWLTYSKASRFPSYQTRYYPNYIGKCRKASSSLRWCGLSLSELAHLIEKTERDIFNHPTGTIGSKAFRHNYPSERATVLSEIQAAWGLVKKFGKSISIEINETNTDVALKQLENQCVDGYDLFLLEANKQAGIVKIITDDGDFVTIPGIEVYTANHNIIELARQQNKLVVRTKDDNNK